MSETLKKILKSIMLGAGVVTSIFAPTVGASIMVAGSAIKTNGTDSSADLLSTAAGNLNSALGQASSTAQSNKVSATLSTLFAGIVAYFPYILISIVGYFLLRPLFKRRRK